MFQDTKLIYKMQLIAFLYSNINKWKLKWKIITVTLNYEKRESVGKYMKGDKTKKKWENICTGNTANVYTQLTTKNGQHTKVMALMRKQTRRSEMSMWKKKLNFHALLMGKQNGTDPVENS